MAQTKFKEGDEVMVNINDGTRKEADWRYAVIKHVYPQKSPLMRLPTGEVMYETTRGVARESAIVKKEPDER